MKRYLINLITFTTLLFTGANTMADQNTHPNLTLLSNFAGEVFINKDLSNLNKYMKEDYIQHNPAVAQGSEGFKAFFAEWFAAIPNFQYELKNIIANDDFVWVYGTYSGTHENEWLGIPATHTQYQFDAIDIFRIEDSKLAEHWDVMDLHTLFTQLQAK